MLSPSGLFFVYGMAILARLPSNNCVGISYSTCAVFMLQQRRHRVICGVDGVGDAAAVDGVAQEDGVGEGL